MKAKEVMKRDTVTVKEDVPIFEAVELLVKHSVTGMPVVEDDMTLVGILSGKDAIELFYSNENDLRKTVGDFMTQPPVYFDEEDDMKDVCDFLVKNIFRRVPIVSKNKLVGIISIQDVLDVILKSRRG